MEGQAVLWLCWQDPPGSGQTRWIARAEGERRKLLDRASAVASVPAVIAAPGFDPNDFDLKVVSR